MAGRLIIAMTGLAQSGKHTAGEHLVRKHGFAQDAFADDIRRALYGTNPPVIETGNGASFEMLVDFVDRVGWNEAKKNPHVQGMLERTGAEGGWMIHGERLWIDRVEKRANALRKGVPLVITDCLTPHEVAWVREHGGFIFRVDRTAQSQAQPGSKVGAHFSGGGVVEHDFMIVNNDSLASLRAQVDAVLDLAIGRHRFRR